MRKLFNFYECMGGHCLAYYPFWHSWQHPVCAYSSRWTLLSVCRKLMSALLIRLSVYSPLVQRFSIANFPVHRFSAQSRVQCRLICNIIPVFGISKDAELCTILGAWRMFQNEQAFVCFSLSFLKSDFSSCLDQKKIWFCCYGCWRRYLKCSRYGAKAPC